MMENLKPIYSMILSPVSRILIKSKIHPNFITLAGVCLSPIAAWNEAQGKWLLAVLFIGIGSIMDGLDGLVARTAGKKSTWGAIFDSTADRITEIAWLAGILLFYLSAPNGRTGILLTFAAMSGSLMVSYVRARSEGAGQPCSSGMVQRPERIVILIACLLAGSAIMIWGLLLLSILTYVTVAQRLITTYIYCKDSHT
jgi:CDP-diacylglycerol--glycerol-3-phosphate 3-phosphatidyltransferase